KRTQSSLRFEPGKKPISFVAPPAKVSDTTRPQTSIASGSSSRKSEELHVSRFISTERGEPRSTSFSLTPALTARSHEPRKAHFQRSDVNVPALMDEETMSAASSVPLSELATGENPWPDLPPSLPFEISEEFANNERELKRYQRLEREQRGILWNE